MDLISTQLQITSTYSVGVHLDPTLNLNMHFNKTYKKAAGRVNLLRRIHSDTDTLSAERIYRAMIMSIFTYCGQITLSWSETRRCQVRNLEEQSHRIILQNSKCLNCELRIATIENFLKKKACFFCFWLLNPLTPGTFCQNCFFFTFWWFWSWIVAKLASVWWKTHW